MLFCERGKKLVVMMSHEVKNSQKVHSKYTLVLKP